MKYYDYRKAKQLIQENNQNLESALLGIKEDWFWTAETIWENGEFKTILFDGDVVEATQQRTQLTKDSLEGISDGEERLKARATVDAQFPGLLIAGISGSCWGTPTLQLCFKNQDSRMIE